MRRGRMGKFGEHGEGFDFSGKDRLRRHMDLELRGARSWMRCWRENPEGL